MVNKILSIDNYRPHLIIEGDNTHVVPLELIKKWISGETVPNPDCTRAIIKEWIGFIVPAKQGLK